MHIQPTPYLLRALSLLTLLVVSSAFVAGSVQAEEAEELSKQTKRTERITVVGSKEKEDLIPGSAYFMEPEELEEVKGGVDDIHRILRRVPGVNVQEEDGYGLRPNIGFRGVSSERSSKITLMEDGVLIAPAPYSAPSAYFFPPAGRMEALEVLKGPGTIKYGPYTNGGSLNMLSTSIPKERDLKAKIQFGEDNTRVTHLRMGDSFKNGGVMLETYQSSTDGFKELDTGGDTGFDIADYVAKVKINTDPAAEIYQELELKLNYYDQNSDETYLGLTQDDFDDNPYRRYAGSQLDEIDVRHRQFMATHYVELGSGLDLTTTGYYNKTTRNWYKLEGVNGSNTGSILSSPSVFAAELAWIKGADSPDDALVLRNNNRAYRSYGVQSVLGATFNVSETEHELEFGVRYHEDYEDRFQDEDSYRMDNRALVLTTDGAPGSNANRKGSADAWAFFLQDRVAWDDLTVTPGVRFEHIDYTREDWGKSDPNRLGTSLARATNTVNEVIPGVGIHYQLSEAVAAFFGIHKGFSPPGPTSSGDVEEEESMNYEWGANYNSGAFRSEVVLFLNDYDNLLGADTVSSGGSGTGDLFNGGESTVFGVEALLGYDFSELIDICGLGLPVYTSYTFSDAQFDSDFDSDFFGDVRDGDQIPYIPEHQLAAGIAVAGEDFRVGLDGHYVDAMATVAGAAGTRSTERTDSYFVFDLEGEVAVTEEVSIFASINNLFDEEYVVARRPAGARPGAPRLFFAGLKVDLG